MTNEIWQEIPVQNIDDQLAFELRWRDQEQELKKRIIHDLNLEDAGYSFDGPLASTEEFKDGHIVQIDPLDPRGVHPNMQSHPPRDRQWEILGSKRWFTAAGYVLHLVGITSTGCYGDRTSYGLTVFNG
jgi:hypothetical protein